jgi:hypothetical protein
MLQQTQHVTLPAAFVYGSCHLQLGADQFAAVCPAGELYLEFTQVNAEQPQKPYGFAVQVLEDEKYRGVLR